MSKNIIDTLNRDPRVKNFMQMMKQVAIRQNITENEWNQYKKDVLLPFAIAICPEALKTLADEIYNKINNK
jgi:pantoate kinase